MFCPSLESPEIEDLCKSYFYLISALYKLFNDYSDRLLVIAEGTEYKDLEITVWVKANSGKEDQGGGPIWRVKDANNYYIARWNPLENNLRVYYVKGGKRKQLASADVNVDPKAWHRISIKHKSNKIEARLDEKTLLEIVDETFPQVGMVGLWTKADAATAFDTFEVKCVR
jgi:hypothetical protein